MRYQKKPSRNKCKRSAIFLFEKNELFSSNVNNIKMANLERFLLAKTIDDLTKCIYSKRGMPLDPWSMALEDIEAKYEEDIKDAKEKFIE